MFFNSLNDFNDYIPNCIVCGKQMKVHLLLSPIRYNDFSLTKLSLDIKDGIARSKSKGLSISIDIMNNKFIDGKDFVYKTFSKKYAYKKCKTCNFSIHTNDINQTSDISKLALSKECLIYTLNNNKNIEIYNFYYDKNYKNTCEYSFIAINKRYLNVKTFVNFSYFKKLKELNKRLKMLIVFQ